MEILSKLGFSMQENRDIDLIWWDIMPEMYLLFSLLMNKFQFD